MGKSKEEIQKEIGYRVHWARKDKDLSQAKLAELTDLDENTIGSIEGGKINTGFINLFKICNVLEITMVELFKDY